MNPSTVKDGKRGVGWREAIPYLRGWFGKRAARRRAGAGRLLGLEGLECRLTPATTGFVQSLYLNLLNRQGSQAEVQSWVNTGETNSQIINGFLTSPEYEGDVIKLDYQTILHRSPDSVGFNFFLDQFQNHHLTKEKLIISIAASDEFFSSTGGTNASFITALYNRLLNRQPDSGGFNGYLNGMAGGESRQRVVSDMIASTEFFSDYAGLDYTNFLHRTGSVSERTSWANTLRAGIESQGNNFFLIDADKGFLNSPEYASKNP